MAKPDVRRTCTDCGYAWTVPGAVAGRPPLLTPGGLLTGITSMLGGVGGRHQGQRRLRMDAMSHGSGADGLRASYAVCGRCTSDLFTDAAIT